MRVGVHVHVHPSATRLAPLNVNRKLTAASDAALYFPHLFPVASDALPPRALFDLLTPRRGQMGVGVAGRQPDPLRRAEEEKSSILSL